VAFESDATDLAPDDGNRERDVFTRDLTAGLTDLVSRRSPLLLPRCSPWTRADGRRLARRPLRVVRQQQPGDHAHRLLRLLQQQPVVCHDQQTGATQIASARPDGAAYVSVDTGARMSADGRFVVFQSQANDLDATVTGTRGRGLSPRHDDWPDADDQPQSGNRRAGERLLRHLGSGAQSRWPLCGFC